MYDQINSIKSANKAKALFKALHAAYIIRVGAKQAEHEDRMAVHSSQYKPNGLAWWKDRCRAVAYSLVAADSVVNHFIPASPETKAWGGFLGGERVMYRDKHAETDAETMILDLIARL